MFDAYVTNPSRTEYVPYEKTVIEKKAPTEESVRLLKEMQEKAQETLIDTITVNNNTFNIKVQVYKDFSVHGHRFQCHFKYTLNHREFEGRFCIDDYDLERREDLIKIIYQKASNEFAKILMSQLKVDKVTGEFLSTY